MAHGRKRSLIGGIVLGVALTVISSAAVIYASGISFGPPGYPYFTESARRATIEWARLSAFPSEARSFSIATFGGMFSREFRVSFFGEPSAVSAWVRSCPGIVDPKTKKTQAEDGGVTFEIPAGAGAAFAELIHYPARGTVSIRTYWN